MDALFIWVAFMYLQSVEIQKRNCIHQIGSENNFPNIYLKYVKLTYSFHIQKSFSRCVRAMRPCSIFLMCHFPFLSAENCSMKSTKGTNTLPHTHPHIHTHTQKHCFLKWFGTPWNCEVFVLENFLLRYRPSTEK